MGPWFLNTLWFTSDGSTDNPGEWEPGWKGEDPNFKEVVPTSASSDSENYMFYIRGPVIPSMQTARADQIGVQRYNKEAWEWGTDSPLKADLETRVMEWTQTWKPAEQQQHPQFRQAEERIQE